MGAEMRGLLRSTLVVVSLALVGCGSSAIPVVTRSASTRPSARPADAQAQRYHDVLRADWKPLNDAYIAAPCLDSQVTANPGGCRAGTAAVRDLARTFLGDLDKLQTPTSFRASDTELRAALSSLITACDAIIAALDANDRPAFAAASEDIGVAHRAAARAQAAML